MTQFSASLAVLSTALWIFLWGRHNDKERDDNKKGTVTYISYILFFIGIVWLISSFEIIIH